MCKYIYVKEGKYNCTLCSEHSSFYRRQYLQLCSDSGYTLANLKKILKKTLDKYKIRFLHTNSMANNHFRCL